LLGTAELNYEQWRDLLRPNWGLYTPDDPKAFVGSVRSSSIYGFNASDISGNARRCERSKRMFALTASTTSMPYFRLLDNQRSSRMIRLCHLLRAMSR
jgi:hypothetical protein